MLGWVGDIERATLENETFRTVLHTGEHVQLTVMRLGPGEDIGREAHHFSTSSCGSSRGPGEIGWAGRGRRGRDQARCGTTGRSSCRRACGTTS